MFNFDLPEFSHAEPTTSQYPLLAKSYGCKFVTLTNHLVDSARMCLTLTLHSSIPSQVKENIQITVFIGGLTHDLGKAASGFQQMLRDPDVKYWPPKDGGNRHEILSVAILLLNFSKLPFWEEHQLMFSSVLIAILAHHKAYTDGRVRSYPKTIPSNQWFGQAHFKTMYQELVVNREHLQKHWEEMVDIIKKDKWASQLLGNCIPHKLEIPEFSKASGRIISEFDKFNLSGYKEGYIDSMEFRSQYSENEIEQISIIRALVTVGDHLSSGETFFVPSTPKLSEYPIFHSPKIKMKKFQKACGREGTLMLRAPTGSGKTEAAEYWAQHNQLRDSYLAKLYYCLPYQASLNAMYSRLNNWFQVRPGQLVSLQHSRASSSLYSLISDAEYSNINSSLEQDDGWEALHVKSIDYEKFSDLLFDSDRSKLPVKHVQMVHSIVRLSRELYFPIKVSTPHQLLKAILQGRGWEVDIRDLRESLIIFDEIHAYNPLLTGLIIGMSKLLIDEFNSRIFFMSASFPSFVIELIKTYIGDIPLVNLDPKDVQDAKELNKYRHIVKVVETDILQLIQEDQILSRISKEESTLIICNTVRVAQNVYAWLKSQLTDLDDDQIILFHSRFKLGDRKTKEELISTISDSRQKIVVATQVVEVSLDIDLSFGIFEGAPLDALVQRLGRVNRKGKREIIYANVMITKPAGYSHLIYNEEQTQYSIYLLQQLKEKKFSEHELVGLIDKVYERFPWNDAQKKRFETAVNHPRIRKFRKNQLPGSYRYWIDDVIEDQATKDVILREDRELFIKKKRQSILKANDLIIPLRVGIKELNTQDQTIPAILEKYYSYSMELGLIRNVDDIISKKK
ncbi:MAG: CRISPR-associated helicase Cas3' [Candidatus Heimdallarchaeota archaeon]|nr:CRISPR-associated helicase Cas3' [Candidatus Heimdallarchaeota archaeon]